MGNKPDLFTNPGINAMVNQSLSFFKENFLDLLKVYMVFMIPSIVLATYFYYEFWDFYMVFLKNMTVGDKFNWESLSGVVQFLLTGGVALLFSSLFGLLSTVMLIKGIDDRMHNITLDLSALARYSLKALPAAILTSIIAILMLTIGMVFCFIPFFIFMVYLTLLPQVFVLEKRWGFDGIGRSFSLTAKNFWIILLFSFVFMIIVSIATSIPMYATMIPSYVEIFRSALNETGQSDPNAMFEAFSKYSGLMSVGMALALVVSALLMPIYYIAFNIKFHGIRNTKEGKAVQEALEKAKGSTQNRN